MNTVKAYLYKLIEKTPTEELPDILDFVIGILTKNVPHRQWVFSIPKRLRIYFMFDRKLLAKLSQCAWQVLSSYLKQGVIYDDANPGAVIAVQTFGDFLNFNPLTCIL